MHGAPGGIQARSRLGTGAGPRVSTVTRTPGLPSGCGWHPACVNPAFDDRRHSTDPVTSLDGDMATIPADTVILVTGASQGIGAEFAKQAAAQGARLALVGRQKDALEEVVTACGGAGRALALVADVTKRADVEAAISRTIDHYGGRLDVLVNNVGRGISRSPSELTDDDIDEMMTINVKSALYGMQSVLAHFKACLLYTSPSPRDS